MQANVLQRQIARKQTPWQVGSVLGWARAGLGQSETLGGRKCVQRQLHAHVHVHSSGGGAATSHLQCKLKAGGGAKGSRITTGAVLARGQPGSDGHTAKPLRPIRSSQLGSQAGTGRAPRQPAGLVQTDQPGSQAGSQAAPEAGYRGRCPLHCPPARCRESRAEGSSQAAS